jgi:DNA-binding transcriptional ArsR family regulator
LEETLENLIKERINTKQIELLLKIEENEGLFYYKLIKKLSKETGLPESTVRWNLNRLRSAKLVITGDKNNKGVPVKLTERGKMIALAFKNGKRSK